MILIFDFFETLLNNKSIDFNRGLKPMWEKYYKDKCSFEEIKAYGEELFQHLLSLHLKRNKNRTVAVILSLALSIVMINVTVSIVASMDSEKYISSFASSDFTIADATTFKAGAIEDVYDGVSFSDISAITDNIGTSEAGFIFMSESSQCIEGVPYERLVKLYEEHPEWFIYDSADKPYYDQMVYEDKSIDSHIYGVSQIVFDKMDIDAQGMTWEKFCFGKYAIVSSPLETGGNDSEYAFYHIGDKISITLPDVSSEEYEVIGNGDVSYAMGPQHSHGSDIVALIEEIRDSE